MSIKPIALMALSLVCANRVYADDANEKTDSDLKTQIEVLKNRVEALEKKADDSDEATQNLAIEVSQQSNKTAANTFNPGIGVVLTGKYLYQDPGDHEFSMPGFILGDESGPGDSGFSAGESEVNLAANIDDKFYGSLTISFENGADVEEAFLQTMALPAGLKVKFGKFLSDIGYLNSHHAHTDDFASRPLVYQAFLGNAFSDSGVQLSWLAPTTLYWESGAELFRGDTFPGAGAGHNGQGISTVYSHVGGDINFSQSWRAGISLMNASVTDRSDPQGELFSGDSKLLIADFVWKWAPNGNTKITNAKIQAEYFKRSEDGTFTNASAVALPLTSHQDGWYLQGVYQFRPQWRIGLRYEQAAAEDLSSDFNSTGLDNLGQRSKQTSAMIDWSNSEFSRVRLQYSHDAASPDTANLWTLQYIAALGAHGAHAF